MKIEYIILSIIAALLILTAVFAFSSANGDADNRQVMADLVQISAAMKIFQEENGFYPAARNGMPEQITEYLEFWPQPETGGSCSSFPEYIYTQKLSGDDYAVSFCLNKKTDGIPKGSYFLTAKGIVQ